MRALTLFAALFFVALGCRKPDPDPGTSDGPPFFDANLITKNWSVDSVRISRTDTLPDLPFFSKSSFVYAKKSPASTADFSRYQLTLNQGGSFSQIDTDGLKSSGIWLLIDQGTTLRLENKDTQLIEHYNVTKLDSATFSFNVVIPKETTYGSLQDRWTSRLGPVYGPLVSKSPLVALMRMNNQ